MKICAYTLGCSNEVTVQHQKYCCKEHSPYAHLYNGNYVPPKNKRTRTFYEKAQDQPPPQDTPMARWKRRAYSRHPKVEDFKLDGKEAVPNDGHDPIE